MLTLKRRNLIWVLEKRIWIKKTITTLDLLVQFYMVTSLHRTAFDHQSFLLFLHYTAQLWLLCYRFEEPETEPYHKYPPHSHPPPSEGRWPPSRYPPPPHRHPPPPGYPYPPYDGRRHPYPEAEFRERDREREREFYHHEGYDRHYYGPKPGERDPHVPSSKSQPPLPPPEKRWPDDRLALCNF